MDRAFTADGFAAVFGTLDATNQVLTALALQPDGKPLLAGYAQRPDTNWHWRLVRLLTNGLVDPTFAGLAGTNPFVSVNALLPLPDGRLLVGGRFSKIGGLTRDGVARLNPDGSLDATFATTPSLSKGGVRALAVLPNGKVLFAGGESAFASEFSPYGLVARLNSNGTLDATLLSASLYANYEGSPWGTIPNALLLQPDGAILVGGDFSTVFNKSAPPPVPVHARFGLVRLSAGGLVDTNYLARLVAGPDATSVAPLPNVQALALQPDGRLLVAGGFTNVNDVAVTDLVRLNPDGSLDPTFWVVPDAGFPEAMALQPDGSLFVVGSNYRLRRLLGDLRPRLTLFSHSSQGPTRLHLTGATGRAYALECSTNLLEWRTLSTNTAEGCLSEFLDPNPEASSQRFYRVRQFTP